MRFLRRSLLGLFLLSVTLALASVAGNTVWRALETRWADEGSSRPARERVFGVNVVKVTTDTVSPEITTFGEIESRRTLEIRAPAAGEIVWLADAFDDGARVEAGQLLARIDPQDATARRDTARADLAEAEADLRDAERTLELAADDLVFAREQARLQASALERQRDLLERGVGTEAAVETAALAAQAAEQSVLSRRQAIAQGEAREDQAGNALERRRIALAEAERLLAETSITAPFAGTLGRVDGTLGRRVAANERLADLIDPLALDVAFRISAGQYARLLGPDGWVPNAPVSVSLDVSGVDIVAAGQITRESPEVEDGQTGRLLFAMLDSAAGFRPGDFVTVRVTEPPLSQVAILPATAIDAAATVLVIGEGDRLETAQTKLLRRQGDTVLVRAPALQGREVVAERTPLLGSGIAVRPIRPGAAPEPETEQLVVLDADRRARLIAFVEASERMPAQAKERMLAQLQRDRVPADMVARLESRMGG